MLHVSASTAIIMYSFIKLLRERHVHNVKSNKEISHLTVVIPVQTEGQGNTPEEDIPVFIIIKIN